MSMSVSSSLRRVALLLAAFGNGCFADGLLGSDTLSDTDPNGEDTSADDGATSAGVEGSSKTGSSSDTTGNGRDSGSIDEGIDSGVVVDDPCSSAGAYDEESCEGIPMTEIGSSRVYCVWTPVQFADIGEGVCAVEGSREACLPAYADVDCGAGPLLCEPSSPGAAYYRPSTRGGARGFDFIVGTNDCLAEPSGFIACSNEDVALDADREVTPCPCACEQIPEALPANFVDELTQLGGCGDLTMEAHSADDTVVLVVGLYEQLVRGVADSQTPIDITRTVTELDLVELRFGTNVTINFCTDAISTGELVFATWQATEGSVRIQIVPDPDSVNEFESLVRATVTLENVVLESSVPGVEPRTIPRIEWIDVVVGQTFG